ncbi:1257_t:CDS:2, partial [Cetraspora pellucida]
NEEMEKKTQALTNLQTQLNLATKTKEELLEYLKIYREMNVISFSSGSNSLAGKRFFSNLDDPQTTKVEKMENFEKFMKQHGNINVVYLHLTNNKLMELGNKNIFNSVRVIKPELADWLDCKDEIKYPTYHSPETWHSKPINTKQITQLLQVSKGIDCVDIPTDTVEISELGEQLKEVNLEEKGETSLSSQIEIPPKNN